MATDNFLIDEARDFLEKSKIGMDCWPDCPLPAAKEIELCQEWIEKLIIFWESQNNVLPKTKYQWVRLKSEIQEFLKKSDSPALYDAGIQEVLETMERIEKEV